MLQVFVPNLKLTRKQTEDAQVQRRLAVQKVSHARLRFQRDRRYSMLRLLVRYEPVLAAKLVLTDQPIRRYEELEAAIVSGARKPCIGAARAVYFDPWQFRFYIADALYRWAVAAAGVETLIDGSVGPEEQAVRTADPVTP